MTNQAQQELAKIMPRIEPKMWQLIDCFQPWTSDQAADDLIETVQAWAVSEGCATRDRLQQTENHV